MADRDDPRKLLDKVKPDWATRVEELLTTQGRMKDWLAHQIGVHPNTLSRLIHGEPGYAVSPELLEKIAQVLGVPYAWLFGDGQEIPENHTTDAL